MTRTSHLLSFVTLLACGPATVSEAEDFVEETGSTTGDVAEDTGGALEPTGGSGDGFPESREGPPRRVNSPPEVVRFEASVTRVTQSEAVEFTVFVIDPDGTEDVLGGVLTDPSGAVLGSFEQKSAGGYALRLGWLELLNRGPLNLWHGEGETRAFRATFSDVSEASASAEVSIEFHCGTLGACDGVCTDRSLDMCGQTCESLGFEEGGTLACNQNCNGYDTGGCLKCGDGVKQEGEACDGSDFGTRSCVEFSADNGFQFTAGSLTCSGTCEASPESCTYCAGTVHGNEPCEDCEPESWTAPSAASLAHHNVPRCIGGDLFLDMHFSQVAALPDYVTAVGGRFIVEHTITVPSLDGLERIVIEGPEVIIRNNRTITDCQAEAYAEALRASGYQGRFTIENNAGCD